MIDRETKKLQINIENGAMITMEKRKFKIILNL